MVWVSDFARLGSLTKTVFSAGALRARLARAHAAVSPSVAGAKAEAGAQHSLSSAGRPSEVNPRRRAALSPSPSSPRDTLKAKKLTKT